MVEILLAGLAALAAGVALAPRVAEARRQPVDAAYQSGAPGRFADLPQGRTHYQWHGPLKGQVAVCIHGLTTPSYVFAGVVPVLTTMGFRVLSYDLLGRGYSDRPGQVQDRAHFLAHLEALLADQGVGDELVLVGYSMGGAIATAFAAEHGARVDRVILLASAGLRDPARGWWAALMARPVIGNWLAVVLGGRQLRRFLSAQNETSAVVPGITGLQMAETRKRGFAAAVHSSTQHFVHADLSAAHGQLAQDLIALLAIWGEEDVVIPPASIGRLAQINRQARQVVVPGAGHGLPFTHPDEVGQAIQDFLRAV